MSKTAIIIGATGLTGSFLVQLLLKDNRYDTLKLFSRTASRIDHPKIQEYLVDMLHLSQYEDNFTGDEVFCCIGTTHAKTPNKELYYQIDYGIPYNAAKLCKKQHISTYIVVSALGANKNSTVFYTRTKGQMEEAILELNIPKTHLLQPSLIAGKRTEKRSGEYIMKLIMKIINPLCIGRLKKYRSIYPQTIASSMVWLANNAYPKKRIVSNVIKEIADHD